MLALMNSNPPASFSGRRRAGRVLLCRPRARRIGASPKTGYLPRPPLFPPFTRKSGLFSISS